MDSSYDIAGLGFYNTCGACPEQYDVLDKKDKQVGYVRLRWGELRCDFPDVGGETIYHYEYNDGFRGEFSSEEERLKHLTKIASAINKKLNNY